MGKSLVILDADFSGNSLLVQVLAPALTICNEGQKAMMKATPTQATVSMYKASLNNTNWGVAPSSDYSDKAKYALNTLPFGTKKVKATDTVKQKQLSIALYDENYIGLFTPVWSGAGNYSQEINVENYPTAKYFSLNYQQKPTDIDTLAIEFSY